MELQRKRTATMSDEKIVDLYWQRDEQAIKETDIKKMILLEMRSVLLKSFVWILAFGFVVSACFEMFVG